MAPREADHSRPWRFQTLTLIITLTLILILNLTLTPGDLKPEPRHWKGFHDADRVQQAFLWQQRFFTLVVPQMVAAAEVAPRIPGWS